MPIRFASLSHQIQRNGLRLHLAIASRALSHEPEEGDGDAEKALRDELHRLKELQKQRHAQALLPRPKAVKPVREAKAPKAPKAPKAAKPPKEAKAKANKPTRADKQAQKAAALEAAKKAHKKSAKT
jgi:hypothetical protein